MAISREEFAEFVKYQKTKHKGITEQEIAQSLIDQGYELEDEFTWGGRLANVLPSAGRTVRDTAMVFTPGGIEGLKDLGIGGLQSGISALTGLDPLEESDKRKYADALGQAMQQRYGSWEKVGRTGYYDPIGLLADVSAVATTGLGAGARVAGALGKAGAAKRLGSLERLAAYGDVGDLALRTPGFLAEYTPWVGRRARGRKAAERKISTEAMGREQHYKSLMGEEFQDTDYKKGKAVMPTHMLFEEYEPMVASAMKRLWAMGGENAVKIEIRQAVKAIEKDVERLIGTTRRKDVLTDKDGNVRFDANAGAAIHQGVLDYKKKFDAEQEKIYSLLGDLTLHPGDFSSTVAVINRLRGKNPEAAKIKSMTPEVQALLKEDTIRALLEANKEAEKIVLSRSTTEGPHKSADQEWNQKQAQVLKAPPSEIIRLYEQAFTSGDVKMLQIIETVGVRRVDQLIEQGVLNSEQVANRAAEIEKTARDRAEPLETEIQGAEDVLSGRLEADESFYRDYAEQYYPMQDVSDRRFRYVELTHPGPFKGPVFDKKKGAAAESVDGYKPADYDRQWKVSEAERRALEKDGRITWVDSRPVAIRYFEDDLPWLKNLWGIPQEDAAIRQRQRFLQSRVETGQQQATGQVEALSSLSEQVFRKLDSTENIRAELRSMMGKVNELRSRSEAVTVGRQMMKGDATSGKGAKRSIESLSGDDYGINLKTVKEIRTQVREKRDGYWKPNKHGETPNRALGDLLDQVYDGLTEDYFGGAEQAADKVSWSNPTLRGALGSVREFNRSYAEGILKIKGEWVIWMRNYADNNEPGTIFHDVVLKGSKQRGSNRRAVMPDERLAEMMEVIGPKNDEDIAGRRAANDVRAAAMAYIFEGARDQEGFFKYGALDSRADEIGRYRLEKLFEGDPEALAGLENVIKDVESIGNRIGAAVGKGGNKVSIKDLVAEGDSNTMNHVRKLFNLQMEATAWKTIIGVPMGTIYNLKVSFRNALALYVMTNASDFTTLRNAGLRNKFIEKDYPTHQQIKHWLIENGSHGLANLAGKVSGKAVRKAGTTGRVFERERDAIEAIINQPMPIGFNPGLE